MSQLTSQPVPPADSPRQSSRESACDTDRPWASLPSIPGGWTEREITVGERSFRLVQPAAPDDFLDDAEVLAANRHDDYMPYWSYLWPAAIDMAHAVLHAPWPRGTNVLELGCGLGLVGLAAATRGDVVTFSDYDPVAVDCSFLNAARNGLAAHSTGRALDWREPPPEQWSVIIGCEVTYERRNHPVLLDLLERILSPEGIVWFGDPGRSQAPPFIRLARERGFIVTARDRHAQLEPVAGDTESRFQILELRRDQS
jgi:predicted nicotinamide N-methyase